MTFKIRLQAKFLKSDHQAFMVQGGQGQHLFEQFLKHQLVAPDVPSIEFAKGEAPKKDKTFEAQIKRGRALREWAWAADNDRGDRPRDALAAWKSVPKRSHHSYYANSVQRILWDIPKGSLVYVPNRNLRGDAILAEMGSRKAQRIPFSGTGKAAGLQFLGRPVDAIKRVPMLDLPEGVLSPARTPGAATYLIRRSDRLRMYREYYGDFVIEGDVGQSRIEVTKDQFLPLDGSVINGLANLVQSYLVTGTLDVPRDAALNPLMTAAFLDLSNTDLRLHLDINSPGDISVEAKTRLSLILPALFVLLTTLSTSEIVSKAAAAEVVIETSSGQVLSDESDRLMNLVQMFQVQQIDAIRQNVLGFEERTGAKVNADGRP